MLNGQRVHGRGRGRRAPTGRNSPFSTRREELALTAEADRPGEVSTRAFYRAGVLMLVSLLYFLPVCFVLRRIEDLGLIPLGADLLVRGGYLYRDMFTVVWPGSYLLLALFFKLFGATWLTSRIVLLLTFLGLMAAMLFLSRRLIRGPLCLFPAVIVMALATPPSSCNFYHWDSLLFFLAGIILQCLVLAGQRSARWLSLSAGLAAGLSTLCYQAGGPANLAGLVVTGLLSGRQSGSWRAGFARFVPAFAGFACVMAAFLAYCLATETWQDMLNCTVYFLMDKSYSSVNAVPYAAADAYERLFAALPVAPGTEAIALSKLVIGYLYWFPFEIVRFAPLLVAVGIVIYFIKGGSIRQAADRHPELLLVLFTGILYWLSELHRPDIKRLVWGEPLLIIVTFRMIELSFTQLPALRLAARLLVIFLAGSLVMHCALNQAYYTQPKTTLETRRGQVVSLDDLSVLPALDRLTKPYEKVLVYPYETSVYFLSRTWFPGSQPLLQYHFNSPEQMKRVVADMEESKVRYVIWDLSRGDESFADHGFVYQPVGAEQLVIEPYVLDNYRMVKAYGRFRLMERKTPFNKATSRQVLRITLH